MFHDLKKLLPQAAQKYQLRGELESSQVLEMSRRFLKEELGEELMRGVRVESFKQGIVWCAVDHAGLSYKLQMKAYVVCQKINRELEKSVVKALRSFQKTPEIEEDHDAAPVYCDGDFFAE